MKLLTTLTIILFSFISSFAQINSTSFATKVDYGTGTTPQGIITADLDNDGKQDVIVGNTSSSSISVFRNTSTLSSINLAAKTDYSTASPINYVHQADLDGDGRIDLVTSSNSGNTFSIFRNTTSTIGMITFAARQDITGTVTPSNFDLQDIDGDSKIDLVGCNYYSNTFSIFRNTSTIGTISLAAKQDIICGNSPGSIVVYDMDNDNKKDVAITLYNANQITIFRNTTSQIGNPTFSSITTVGTGTLPNFIKAEDIDGDGKRDLVTANWGGNISVVKNTTSGINAISFQAAQNFVSGVGTSNCQGISLTDFDQDNKIDITVGNRNNNSISVFRNTTITGIINSSSLAAQVTFSVNSFPTELFASDLNGDGKKDLLVANNGANNISILKNQTIPSNGLIAYYPFNGNAGDSSGFENHGTVTGATLANDRKGNGNSAYYFNGTSRVTVPVNISLRPVDRITIAVWVRSEPKASGWNTLLSYRNTNSGTPYNSYAIATIPLAPYSNKWGLFLSSNQNTNDNEVISKNPKPDFTWTHLATSYDGTAMRIYINGILDTSNTINLGSFVYNNLSFTIGDMPSIPNNGFTGTLDDLRIYNRALSLSEIQELAEFRKTYYSKSTGNLNSLSTWGTNADGSGTAPLSFDSINVTYRVVNNTSPTLGGNLRIGGANSTLVFGDGTNAFNLVIGASDTISCDSMFVQENITLTNTGALVCTKLGAANNSNVQYIRSTPQLVAAGSYGNLVASSSTKTLTGNTTIKGTFGMLASINCNGFNLTLGSSAASTGLLNRSSGTIIGRFTRWFSNATNTGTTGLFPVGTATKYTPYQIEFTSAPTTGGTITCEFITGNPGNIGLPQFDFTTGAVFIDKAAIDGVWRLSGSAVTGGTFNATITANSFVGVNSYADLRLIRRVQAGSWTLQGNATVNAGSNTAAIVGRIGLSTIYGEYGIGGDQSVNPLPVKLVSFTASLISNERTLLQWQTAQEFNADYFIVQRSTDQINWVDRGMMKAKGFSNSLVKYALNDAIEHAFDIVYYRLVQVDVNGKKTGSITVSVTPTKAPEFSVFPNPAQRNVYVQGLASEAIVYNITGLPILTIAKDGWVNIEHLKAGLYFVKSEQKTIRLVVE